MVSDKKFSFSHLKGKEFNALGAKSTREYFEKWGLTRNSLQVFGYEEFLNVDSKTDFVEAFFTNDSVQSSFKTFSASDELVKINKIDFKDASVEVIPTTVLSTNFFDPLYKNSVVRQNGEIKKCYDEVIDDFLVSDEVRKLVLSEESEFFAIFSQEERKEFMFCIFRHLVLGGYCCQYEDNVQPYIETTKHLYKELLSVRKDMNSKQLYVQSIVLKVILKNENDKVVFPGQTDNCQNFCYMIINPEIRQIFIWHHIWNL